MPESSIAMRIAQFSDVHMLPEGLSVEGFTRALRQIHAARPKVDLIINSGDCVMDAMLADRQWAEAQWRAFVKVMTAEVTLPIVHCIGNHDVWGWGVPASGAADHPDSQTGKELAMQSLGLPHRYYSIDRGGWHFVVLDSIHPKDHPSEQDYTGKLDDEQRAWLTQDLDRTPSETPVCVVSHIPILCACEFLDGENETSGDWVVPGAWLHIDARWLWQLFGRHPNVRQCLSGHSHQVEDLRYHGVKYLTDGAISANWWAGPYFDFPPGYVMLTLHTDGASESRFVTYA